MPLNHAIHVLAWSLSAFAPPVQGLHGRACEIFVSAPDELSRAQIEGKIHKNVPHEYDLRIQDWPTQYAEASPPAERWYKVVRGEGDQWLLIYRDFDDGELTEELIQRTGNAIEADISGEIAMLAHAACRELHHFERALIEIDTTPAPVEPSLPVEPTGAGLLATSLSFGLTGLVLGIGGFAYAYDARVRADEDIGNCRTSGATWDECRGRHPQYMWRLRSMVGTGVGSTGAALLGVGLILAIPTALRMSPARRAARANPTISVWGHGSGGGIWIQGRF